MSASVNFVPMAVEFIDSMGSDASVVRAARVSFANDKTSDPERDAKLIRYLAKHNHWTPFAHTQITLRVTCPIPIRTQCFKHKFGFVENEESRRYVKYTPNGFMPLFREATASKKQGSGGEITGMKQALLQNAYEVQMIRAIQTYEYLLEQGVCEEQARFILPQGVMVNFYWTGSLAAFARFFKQRTDPHAQLEIQQLAKMVGDIIEPMFPLSWKELTTEEDF